MPARDALVFDAVRTPRGKAAPTGALAGVKPVALLARVLDALVARNRFDPSAVEDVIVGCVTQIGDQGANLGKIAALYAGWPPSVSGATVNRFCASGVEAVQRAALAVIGGAAELVVAGGVESMSRVPIFADQGAWFADADVARATRYVHMAASADLIAALEGLSREALDAYAATSHLRAARAWREGRFARSIVPVPVDGRTVDRDELVRDDATPERLAALEPMLARPALADVAAASAATIRAAYPELGPIAPRHHVGSAPQTADGAAAVLIGTAEAGRRLGLTPRARIAAVGNAAVDPVLMLTGNVDAARRALARADVALAAIDLFEINESFAAIPLHFARALDVDPDRLNVNGGAIALGHPLGATGPILLGTALDELERLGARRALVSVCGGAGVAASLVIERV